MLSVRLPVSLPSSESAFSVVLVRSEGRPMRRRGPSRLHVGPVLLESWWHSLSAARVGVGDSESSVSSSWSPLVPSRLVLESPARWPSVGSARDGAVCRAAAVTVLLGLLAECPCVMDVLPCCPSRYELARSRGLPIPTDNFPNELARVCDSVGMLSFGISNPCDRAGSCRLGQPGRTTITPRLSPASALLVAPVVSTLGGSRAASRDSR